MGNDGDNNDSNGNSAPPSKGKRFFELAKMTASVAGNYTRSKVGSLFQSEEDGKASHAAAQRKNGEIVAETLGNLKGAAMKIGQMASVATDVLPDEIAEPLEALQKDAPPMGFEVVAEQIERELGARPEILFDDFDPTPFASASIGQVHRAVTDDGRQVVVKVQYPGVDDSVGTDISQLKMALKLSGFVDKGRRRAFESLFDEIEKRLEEELDYTNEAENVRLFRRIHADDDFVILPEVVGERSAKRVLTLTQVTGDSLQEARDSYSWEQKDAVGESLFRMFGAQLYREGIIHADPNPANFAFRPDGRVVLYDYGCVKKLTPEKVEVYAAVVRAGLEGDVDMTVEAMQQLGALNPDGPEVPEEVWQTFRHIFMEPVLEQEHYDYGDAEIYARLKANKDIFIKYNRAFQPPPGGVYVDRTVVGIHNILRKLEAQVYCAKWMRHFVSLGETATERLDR